jgi:tetratricopeptide (TPR) repeat protein
LGLREEAILTLTDGLNSDNAQGCLEKRGHCYFDLQLYEKAAMDFERCSENPGILSGSLFYLKGLCYYRLKKSMEAILAFE